MPPAAESEMPKTVLRLVTCGSVDDGKSTLLGRLMFEADALPDDQLAQLKQDSAGRLVGPEGLDFSLVFDGLIAEREQGITIDVAYRYLDTARRRLIIGDAPGHEQYTRNMVTAASRAQAAILLVDARRGVLRQTRRHASIIALMGVRAVILAVNKMDLVDFDVARFDAIVADFARFCGTAGLGAATAIPVSGLLGTNVSRRDGRTPWYGGPTLADAVDAIAPAEDGAQAFRFPVQMAVRSGGDFRGYAGSVTGGTIRVGDPVTVYPSSLASRVKAIPTFDGELAAAGPDRAVTLVLADERDVSRGDVLADPDHPPTVADQFTANLFWMDEEPLYPGRRYAIRLAATLAEAWITEIRHRIDIDTLEHRKAKSLALNEFASVKVAADRPLVFDAYRDNREMGGFVLIDRMTNRAVAAGTIEHALWRGQNVAWQSFDVDRARRAEMKGQTPAILWLTGLSGAGKSTIANLLERRLSAAGRHCYILDGDNVRHGLNGNLGFTAADRIENIRRVAEVARLMADAGLIVIVSLISPFARERELARTIAGDVAFFEVHVHAPIEVCEARDPKGLYRKAREGLIANFTGIDSPYEVPEHPDLRLDTAAAPPEALAESLLASLRAKGLGV